MAIIGGVGVHARATMWGEVVRRMLRFRLYGELLRTRTNWFLERAAVPLVGKVAVVIGRSLASATVNPSRVGFS